MATQPRLAWDKAFSGERLNAKSIELAASDLRLSFTRACVR